ncbi:UNVERIFIED_CONTAM: hypothetical protein FKN15_038951 [Acipenser sinensis]
MKYNSLHEACKRNMEMRRGKKKAATPRVDAAFEMKTVRNFQGDSTQPKLRRDSTRTGLSEGF